MRLYQDSKLPPIARYTQLVMFSKALAKIDLLTDTNPVFRTIMRDMKEMIAATYRDSRQGVQFQNHLAQTHILLRHAAGPASEGPAYKFFE